MKLICVAFIGFQGSAAYAQSELVWSDWEKIDSIEPSVRGWTWIYLEDNAKVSCSPGTENKTPFLPYSTSGANNIPVTQNGGYDRVYSTILTAMISGLEVRFRVAPSSDGLYCQVERIVVR